MKSRKMTSPEDREKRLRRLKRNEAARSLRNFKPQKIPNKKKRQKYEPPSEGRETWFDRTIMD